MSQQMQGLWLGTQLTLSCQCAAAGARCVDAHGFLCFRHPRQPQRPCIPQATVKSVIEHIHQVTVAGPRTQRFAWQGVAWVNGFNLGWYWPDRGPQMTLFIPGPLLRPGDNEIVLLEMHRIPEVPAGKKAKACAADAWV